MEGKSDTLKKRIGLIVVLAAVGTLAAFVGPVARLGFDLSESLAAHPGISRVVAYVLLAIGAIKCWDTLYEWRTLRGRQALACYVAFGFGMSGVYYLVHETGHGCFDFHDHATAPSILDFVYFSFVTVTTVGYGDIVPRHAFVRILVLSQVLFGLLLILILSRPAQGSEDS